MRRVVLGLLGVVWWVACAAPPPGVTPALREVVPPIVDSVVGAPVELRGEGWLPRTTLDFDRPSRSVVDSPVAAFLTRGGERVDLGEVSWRDVGRVSAVVPGAVALGAWAVHLVTPRGQELVLEDGLSVVDCLVTACASLDGGVVVVDPDAGPPPMPCTDFTWADVDHDGYGAPDSGAFVCGAARVPVAGDCNDDDGLAHPDAGEVCNGLDDDCDAVTDDGACGDAGAAFVAVTTLEDPDHDFLSASAMGPRLVWIAGGDFLFVGQQPDGGFVDAAADCPGGLRAVWAAPVGKAFVAGGNNGVGRLTTNDPSTRACAPAKLVTDPAVGLVGFSVGASGLQVEGVLRDGRRLSWDGVGVVVERATTLPVGVVLTDVHGVAPTALYAVGSRPAAGTGALVPAAYRLGTSGGFVEEPLPLQGAPSGALRGVWALSSEDVVAVGDQGLAFRRGARGWMRLEAPDAVDFTSVRAFAPGRLYATTQQGQLRRWVGRTWDVVADNGRGIPWRDVTGVDEASLWLVGDDGLVAHGPW